MVAAPHGLHAREVAYILDHSGARLLIATPDRAAPDDTAWLFYTSGTTGRPKGAMLMHRNLLSMTANYFVDVDRVAPGDAILHAAPMTHGSGCYMLVHVAAGEVDAMLAEGIDPALIENAARMAGMATGPLAVTDEVSLDLQRLVVDQAEADGLPDRFRRLHARPVIRAFDELNRLCR